jgi:hypothetical protein
MRKGLPTAAPLRSRFRDFFRAFLFANPLRDLAKWPTGVRADSVNRPAELCDAAFPGIGNVEPIKIADVRITG